MKSARRSLLATGVTFLAIGLVFLAVSMGIWQSMQTLKETGVSAQGEFISVGKGDTWIRYQAGGETYDIHSSTYSADMHVGDQVTVWYMPGEPGNGRMEHWVVWGVYMIVGGVFGLIGAGFLAGVLPKILIRRSLLTNGTPVTAQVTEVCCIRWMKINSRHPYVVHAVCIHPYTGQEMKVKSEYLMEDPRPYITDHTVKVLVDPMQENRYYMLVEELRRTSISH